MNTQRKYANIKIKGEGNIGVLDLGEINFKDGEDANRVALLHRAELKLVDALQRHFDCQVKTIFSYSLSVTPLDIKIDVVICGLDGDYNEEVILEETWIY